MARVRIVKIRTHIDTIWEGPDTSGLPDTSGCNGTSRDIAGIRLDTWGPEMSGHSLEGQDTSGRSGCDREVQT